MQKTLHKMWNYKWVYLMLLPVIIYFIVFKYVPMYGIVLAFKDYNVFKGIMESPWVGFKIFQKIFANKNFWNSIRNTFSLNLLTLAVSFPLTIIVSLMINEVMHQRSSDLSGALQDCCAVRYCAWKGAAGEGTVPSGLCRF